MKRTGRWALYALACVALAVVALRVAASLDDRLGERHRPTAIPLRLWLDPAGNPRAFADYLAATKQALAAHRWVIAGESARERADRIALIAPMEWPLRPGCDSRVTDGVLLLHGLTDSPFLMRDLGEFYAGLPRCLLVRSVLLPGHGSAPGDMLRVDAEDWIEAARYGIESFKGQAAAVHVAGFSTGGALALYWAYNAGDLGVPLRSLMLFSPAMRPTGRFVRLNLLPHIAFALSRLTGQGAWPDVHADQDYAKYESFALNGGYQIYVLDQKLKRHAGRRLPVPVFAALSRNDTTVNAEDSIRMFLSSASPSSRMMLVAPDKDEKLVALARADSRVEWFDAKRPESGKVIDFAHTSFVASPDNRHYGRTGDYAECLAYAGPNGNADKYCRCITAQMTAPQCPVRGADGWVWGEHDAASVEKHVLRRLTFNPYFAEMTRRMGEFMAEAGGR